MSTSQFHHRYRPEIDGLRAIAVLAVILYHADAPFLSGGYVGVDVFFVISGYLITSMMMVQHQSGSFSLLQFYERRARRILPALFLVLFLVSATAWGMIPENLAHDTYESVLAALTMSSNIVFWRSVSYWDPTVDLRPLLHTWSLGVEEQFYLLYPLLFVLLWKGERNGRRWVLPAVLVVAGISFGLYLWLLNGRENSAFFLLPARLWELLAGAATAWLLPNQVRAWESAKWHMRARQLGACMGAVQILLAACYEPIGTAVRLVLSVAGAVMLLAFALPTTWVGRVLGSRLFVGIGLISYSAYLFHQPVFVAVRLWHPTVPGLPVMLGASLIVLLLAWASWRFIEQPFRQERVIGRRKFLVTMAVGVVVIGVFGVLGYRTNAPYALYRATSTDRQRAVYDETFVGKILERSSECWLGNFELYRPDIDAYESCAQRYGRAIIVMGDSHGYNLYSGLAQTIRHPFVVFSIQPVCDATDTRCVYRSVFELIRARAQAVQTVLYLNNGRKVMRNPDRNFAPSVKKIDRYLGELASIAGLPQGPGVYMIGPYVEPALVTQPLLRYAYACERGRAAVPPETVRIFERLDSAFLQRISAFPNVGYVSTLRHYSEEGDAYLYDCDALYWYDRHHFTRAGERRLVEWLAQDIPAIAD
jgi:peptidoglycan/LPS O-acetylase OafA/YrhL